GRCSKVVQSPAPSRPIAKGLAGPGLLAHVLVSKYCDHLPLNRQSQIYAREGVELSRSTLADWVGESSALLRPLVEALAEHVLSAEKVHADDTPVPVLYPGRGTTKQGRLWVYVRDDRPAGDETPPAAWFAYSPDRKGKHPAQHLESFRGVLRVPAHDGQDSEPMADTIPAAWRTVFRPDRGHFGGRSGTLSAMISERCPRSPARDR